MANRKVSLKARLILYHKGKILLLKQTKPNGGNYTLVGGTVENFEYARQSLIRESYEEAEANMMSARQRVIELQERRGILSADREVATVFQQISNFELQLQEERLRLSELLSNPRPNSTRVEVAERNIASLETLIESLRSGLTDTDTGETSLARVQSELMVAETDLETRQQMLSQALQQMEGARIEANRQTLYLSIGVFPIAPDEAAYPRSFENTLLAFLVFSGIYLLISMTASILREQVSA